MRDVLVDVCDDPLYTVFEAVDVGAHERGIERVSKAARELRGEGRLPAALVLGRPLADEASPREPVGVHLTLPEETA